MEAPVLILPRNDAELARAAVDLEQAVPRLQPCLTAGVRLHDMPNSLRHTGAGRDVGQTDAQEPLEVVLNEGSALQRCEEDLAEEPLSAVIHASVLIGKCGGKIRVPGSHAGPDLAADRRPHAVGEPVVMLAANGGLDTQEEVGLAQTVLVPGVGEMITPGLPKVALSDLRAYLSQFRQPDQLQVQVVIGNGALGHRIVEGQ